MALVSKAQTITDIRHPVYKAREADWRKYRLTYWGGDHFISEYLERFSSRETNADFKRRLKMAYNPGHAKAAVDDVRNAIYQRLVDVVRITQDKTYNDAVQGENGGVDLQGSTMNGYLGRVIMPELLSMGKVGVYVDKDQMPAENLAEQVRANVRPYLYFYQIEDILSWRYDRKNQLVSLLLRDTSEEVDEKTGLVSGEVTTYRLLKKVDHNTVSVEIYPHVPKNKKNSPPVEPTEVHLLKLKRIPFVIFDIGDSLLKDISDYQIALLNLASSDLNYAIKANYPFYIEQFSLSQFNPFLAQSTDKSIVDLGVDETCAADACPPPTPSMSVGTGEGRRYPEGLNPPAFIHPSAEPLMASMQKQEQLKTEIRQLMNIALTNVAPQRASAESKEKDDRGLEAGLSYIGLCLRNGERQIAYIWADYQNKPQKNIVISYPDNYSLKSDSDRRSEAVELAELLPTIPSLSYQRYLAKQIARLILGTKVPPSKLDEILSEIDKAEVICVDPDLIRKDVEVGLLTRALGSKARLYPEGESERALEEKAAIAALTLAAQTSPEATDSASQNLGARGAKELDPDPASAKDEKKVAQDPENNLDGKKLTRGEGK